MTQPLPHPLMAIRRTGTVAGVANAPATLTINIGGDTTDIELPYLSSYAWPTVGDMVVILGIPGDSVVIGTLSQWLASDGTIASSATAGGPRGLLDDSSSVTAVPLTTLAGDVASPVDYTFTLDRPRAIKVTARANFQLGTTAAAGFLLYAAYSVGTVADVNNYTTLDLPSRQSNNSGQAGLNWAVSATAVGSAVLPTGTYTTFAVARRVVGGSASDAAAGWVLITEDVRSGS